MLETIQDMSRPFNVTDTKHIVCCSVHVLYIGSCGHTSITTLEHCSKSTYAPCYRLCNTSELLLLLIHEPVRFTAICSNVKLALTTVCAFQFMGSQPRGRTPFRGSHDVFQGSSDD